MARARGTPYWRNWITTRVNHASHCNGHESRARLAQSKLDEKGKEKADISNNENIGTTNSPNGSEPNGLLKGSFTEVLESLFESVVFLGSELPPDGLNGSELKKLSVGLWNRMKRTPFWSITTDSDNTQSTSLNSKQIHVTNEPIRIGSKYT